MEVGSPTGEYFVGDEVRLNGKPLTGVFWASSELGEVHIAEMHWSSGETIRDEESPHGFRYLVLTGEVGIDAPPLIVSSGNQFEFCGFVNPVCDETTNKIRVPKDREPLSDGHHYAWAFPEISAEPGQSLLVGDGDQCLSWEWERVPAPSRWQMSLDLDQMEEVADKVAALSAKIARETARQMDEQIMLAPAPEPPINPCDHVHEGIHFMKKSTRNSLFLKKAASTTADLCRSGSMQEGMEFLWDDDPRTDAHTWTIYPPRSDFRVVFKVEVASETMTKHAPQAVEQHIARELERLADYWKRKSGLA